MGDAIIYCERCENPVGCHMQRKCHHETEAHQSGSDQRIVRRWDINTSKQGKTLTTTVECTRLTASLYADRMTQRGECHLISITPNSDSQTKVAY